MLFTLEPLKAFEGDCLLLHWGTKADPKHAVIDGGPGQTYEDFLEPRLKAISAKRKVAPLPIELVMVSHVDTDHIIGVKKAYRALKKIVEKNLPASERKFEFKRLWHNIFNDILGDSLDAYYKSITASFQASVNGEPDPKLVDKLAKAYKKHHKLNGEDAAHAAYDVSQILASHGDGRELRDDQEFLHTQNVTAAINSPFKKNGKPTLITAPSKAVKIEGLELTVLGPADTEIKALQKDFDKYITEHDLVVEAAVAVDKSPTNLSSIVCLATLGGKTILLTGDAQGDLVLAGLKAAKLLTGTKPLKIDVLKVPHHGSDYNASPEFFKKIVADHYVFSCNGKNGNPERQTLQWLVDARKSTDKYNIYLTYTVDEIDKEREAFAKKKHKPWSAAKHSLKAFFADAKPKNAFTLHEGAPFKIELGDEKIAW